MDLLKPEVIERIESLNLRAKLVVEGFLVGLHQSPFHGFSLEFREHRPYYPGDPINRIDWKLFGRTDRFYLRKYQAETNLSAYILLDISKSMDYGENLTKFEYARTLAASLSYLLLHQNDSVGLVLFDSRIKNMLPPRSKIAHLKRILTELEKASADGKTSISRVLHDFASILKKRSLIILLSDLLGNPEGVIRYLKILRARKNEAIVFHILHPDEVNFNFSQQALFRDMEDKTTLPVNPAVIKEVYLRRFKEFTEEYRTGFLKNSIDYNRINTDISYIRALSAYLEKRKKLL